MTEFMYNNIKRLFICIIILFITLFSAQNSAFAGQDMPSASKAATDTNTINTGADNNPLLQSYTTPRQTPPFDKIKPEHFMPALQYALSLQKTELENIINNHAEPTFANTVEAIERSGELANRIVNVLFALNSAETNPAIQEATTNASMLLADHQNDIYFNQSLFAT